MFRQGKGLHGWGAQTFLRHALSCIEADFSVSLDATPNLHFDRLISTTFPEVVEKGRASTLQARLISTTFPEVVEKGRASILQARLISTTSSESGHAVSVTKNVVDLGRQFLTDTKKNVVDLERYFSAKSRQFRHKSGHDCYKRLGDFLLRNKIGTTRPFGKSPKLNKRETQGKNEPKKIHE